MSEWFDKAIMEPWVFISFAVVIGVWRVVSWLAKKLFDEDKGLFTRLLNDLQKDSQTTKETIAEVARVNAVTLAGFQSALVSSIDGQSRDIVSLGKSVESLERQLISAIQAKPSDEELFSVLFTDNPTPICFIGPDHKFLRINRACEEFWGYSAGELSLMTFSELTLEEDIPADLENVEQVKTGSLSRYRMQKTYVRKDGKKIRAILYVFRYPSTGAFLHYISIVVPVV